MNYPNFYQPIQQPFIQQQPYPQTYQQQYNKIAGKVVNNFDEIMANDVPMDNIAIFPKADRSEIELRQWNANGTISRVVYKPVMEEPQEEKVDTFKEYMDGINERFDKLEKMLKPTRAKKEVEE